MQIFKIGASPKSLKREFLKMSLQHMMKENAFSKYSFHEISKRLLFLETIRASLTLARALFGISLAFIYIEKK